MSDMNYDVVVVGSGAGGMLAAIRAHDLGLKAVVIEKTARYGGTSAIPGVGIWIPSNAWIKELDAERKRDATAAKALPYLRHCTEGKVSDDRLNAYISASVALVDYLDHLG